MKLELKITPTRFISPAGNSSEALIDVEGIFTSEGFPFLNGKRVKGLLRESVREVLEIQQSPHIDESVEEIFGKGNRNDQSQILIDFPNLYIEDYDLLKQSCRAQSKEDALLPHLVKKRYSSLKSTTAMNDKGVAKEKSLRTYRMINPSTDEWPIRYSCLLELSGEESRLQWAKEILQKGALQLRHLGTSRNRGLGRIACELKERNDLSTKSIDKFTVSSNGLNIEILTKESVILASSSGDQNTIHSKEEISGSGLRGILANKYINLIRAKGQEFDQEEFYEIFLSSKLTFSSCIPEGAQKIPYHLQSIKGEKESDLVNIFSADQSDSGVITKIKNGRGVRKIDRIKEHKIDKRLNFHSSRLNRRAGRSTKDETGIFYYESLDPGINFKGSIIGDAKLLSKLVDVIGSEAEIQLGKSKSSQYGNAKIKFSNVEKSVSDDVKSDGKYIVALEAPLILRNSNLMAIPSLSLLKKELEDLFETEIKVENAVARTDKIERYHVLWKSKSTLEFAYAEGSSFLIAGEIAEGTYSIGFETSLGCGKIKVNKFEGKNMKCSLHEKGMGDNVAEKSKVIASLKQLYEKETQYDSVKCAALDLVVSKKLNQKVLTNSLCKRLDNLLMSSDTEKEFKNKMNKLGTQQAGTKLKNAFLFDRISGLMLPPNKERLKSIETFDLRRTYWHTIFYGLTKLKDNV